jgi:hypothetical protein
MEFVCSENPQANKAARQLSSKAAILAAISHLYKWIEPHQLIEALSYPEWRSSFIECCNSGYLRASLI